MINTTNFKLKAFLRASKRNHQGIPIYFKVYTDNWSWISSGVRVSDESCWIQDAEMIHASHAQAFKLNTLLMKKRESLQEHLMKLHYGDMDFSAENLLNLVKGKTIKRRKSLPTLQLRDAYLKARELQVERGDLARSTFKSEGYALNKLESFIQKELGKKDLPINKLSIDTAEDFEYYLRSQFKLEGNSAMKTIKIVKRMLNWGVRKKWMEKNPFEDFKLKFTWKTRDVLTQGEIDAIANKTFMIKRIDVVRDLFLFACYSGLAYADVIALKRDSIIRGIDGNEWIKATRQKSSTTFNTPILPPARAILDKYAEEPGVLDTESVLPRLSNQKVNSYLKEIQDLCGIQKNLTFHLARHTFATTIALANGVPLESVAKMLGHKKLSTTQVYAQVLEQKLTLDTEVLRGRFGVIQEKKVAE